VNAAQALIRNVGTCHPMLRENSKRKTRKEEIPMRMAGAEQPVLVMKPCNGSGGGGRARSHRIAGANPAG
jgi:hypothetical protein